MNLKKDDNLALKNLRYAEQKLTRYGGFRSEKYYYRFCKCYIRLRKVGDFLRNLDLLLETTESKKVENIRKHCKKLIFEIYQESDEPDVVHLLKHLSQIFPDDAEFCFYYGASEIQINRNNKDGKHFIEKSFNLKIANLSWLYLAKGTIFYDHLGLKAEGLQSLKKAVELDRSPLNLLEYAYRLSETDYKKAHEIYCELYKYNNSVGVLSGLAETFSRDSDFEKGLLFAEKAHQVDPTNPKNLSWLGYIHYQFGHYKQALHFYKESEKYSQHNKEYVIKSIAECYEKLGDLKSAENYYCESKKFSD